MGCLSSKHDALSPYKAREKKDSMSFTNEELMRRRMSQTLTPRNRSMPSADTLSVTKSADPKDLDGHSVVKMIDLRIIGGFDPLQGQGTKQCQDDCDFEIMDEVHPTVKASGGESLDVVCCLFDGHGSFGRMISHFCTERYLDTLITNGLVKDTDLQTVLEMTMLHLHSQLKASDDIDMRYSGTTAMIALFRGTALHVANVGDSRSVLLAKNKSGKLYVRGSTVDHKVEDESEQRRIRKMGGRIERLVDENGEECGPVRAWLKDENSPGIAMSRSLGDAVAHMIGVISNADVTEYELNAQDAYFVMASDGVWEVFEGDELAAFVQSNPGHGNDTLADMICEEALKRWNKLVTEEDTLIDDISALVCTLSP